MFCVFQIQGLELELSRRPDGIELDDLTHLRAGGDEDNEDNPVGGGGASPSPAEADQGQEEAVVVEGERIEEVCPLELLAGRNFIV